MHLWARLYLFTKYVHVSRADDKLEQKCDEKINISYKIISLTQKTMCER